MGAFLRELLESLALVIILGLLPVGAHWLFSLEKIGDTRGWVVPELYLFVMVTSGHAAAEAFRDSERFSRTVVFITGVLGVLTGAGSYGILYVHPTSPDARGVEVWLQAHVIHFMVAVAVGYTVYRGIGLFGDSRTRATKKVPKAMAGASE